MGKQQAVSETVGRNKEILFKSVNLNYDDFKNERLAWDYEKLMSSVGYSLDEIRDIQKEVYVGNTPLLELKNMTPPYPQNFSAGERRQNFPERRGKQPHWKLQRPSCSSSGIRGQEKWLSWSNCLFQRKLRRCSGLSGSPPGIKSIVAPGSL